MKYIFLFLLLPFYAASEEENQNKIDTPVFIYRGGPYYSRGVLCRHPRLYFSRSGYCPYYYHYWEHRFDFKTERPENHTLRENVNNFHLEALSGDANAQSFLASYYERGLGVPMDLSKAYAWHKISADNGNIVSQHKLKNLIERVSPEVVEKGEEQVFILYEKISSFHNTNTDQSSK